MFGPGLWPCVLRAPVERGEHTVRSVRGYTSPPMSSLRRCPTAHALAFSKRPLAWGGGGLGSAILPQFYRNFSMMPLFKNFIFPLRNILSLPSLLRGTLYVYVFSSVLHVIFVAGRFLFFVFPKCHPLLGTVLAAMVKGQ